MRLSAISDGAVRLLNAGTSAAAPPTSPPLRGRRAPLPPRSLARPRDAARTMINSSAMCRRQEAPHLQRALDTNLQNVRKAALAAACAWEAQALEAERFEAGFRDALSEEDAAIALEFLLEEEADARNTDNCPDKAPSPGCRTSSMSKGPRGRV